MSNSKGANDSRAKGFTTYYSGANKDELLPPKSNAEGRNSSGRQRKGWGAPASLILGRRVQGDIDSSESNQVTETAVDSGYQQDDVNYTSSLFLGTREKVAEVIDNAISHLSTEYKFRLRFTSTWSKAKYLSLKRIQISLIDSSTTTSNTTTDDSNIPSSSSSESYIDIDLLDLDNVQIVVLSDLMLLPPSHESSKTLYKLVSNTNTAKTNKHFDDNTNTSSNWICPITSYAGASIEINISGDLSPKYFRVSSPSEVPIIKVDIWNGEYIESKSMSPAKDFALFCNSICIYSGELPLSSSSLLAESLLPSWSIAFPLHSGPTTVAPKKAVDTSDEQLLNTSEHYDVPVLKESNSGIDDAVVSPRQPDVVADDQRSWLSELRASSMTPLHADIIDNTTTMPLVESYTAFTTADPDPLNGSSQRISSSRRGSRRISSILNDSSAPLIAAVPNNSQIAATSSTPSNVNDEMMQAMVAGFGSIMAGKVGQDTPRASSSSRRRRRTSEAGLATITSPLPATSVKDTTTSQSTPVVMQVVHTPIKTPLAPSSSSRPIIVTSTDINNAHLNSPLKGTISSPVEVSDTANSIHSSPPDASPPALSPRTLDAALLEERRLKKLQRLERMAQVQEAVNSTLAVISDVAATANALPPSARNASTASLPVVTSVDPKQLSQGKLHFMSSYKLYIACFLFC